MIYFNNFFNYHVDNEEKVEKTKEIVTCIDNKLTYEEVDEAFDIVRRCLNKEVGHKKIQSLNKLHFLFSTSLNFYFDFFVAIIKGILSGINVNSLKDLVLEDTNIDLNIVHTTRYLSYSGPNFVNPADLIYCQLIRIHPFNINEFKYLSQHYKDIVNKYNGCNTKCAIKK